MEPVSQWRNLFLDLVDDLSRELDSEPIGRGHDDGGPLAVELELDGNTVELFHDWSHGPNRITASVHCGLIVETGSAEVLKRLLQAQHDADPCDGTSFGLDAESGALLFVACMALHGLSAAELVARLRKMFVALATLRDTDPVPIAQGSMREVIFQSFAS